MSRPHRLHVPGAFYHVTLRGNHRQDIFFTERDRLLFLEILAETITRFGSRVHAYCLMTNHVHLIIQVGSVALGRVMQRVAGTYARRVQQRLDTTGHMFEKRYHPVLIDADRYLLAVVRYVHLNPVKAGLAANAADYRWSSHQTFVGARAEPWVTTEFLLGMFNVQADVAVSAYRRLVEGCTNGFDVADDPLGKRNAADPRVLGDDEFVAKLHGRSCRPEPRKSLRDIIDEATDRFSIPVQALYSTSRAHGVAKARAWIAFQAVNLKVATMSDVARQFGRTEGALRHAARRHFDFP
ncbi:MAG TPA: transposase [Woeseiaceae bacterium]|nr:transposase [Woeseiaceae bacterium]